MPLMPPIRFITLLIIFATFSLLLIRFIADACCRRREPRITAQYMSPFDTMLFTLFFIDMFFSATPPLALLSHARRFRVTAGLLAAMLIDAVCHA